jgi:hypothetical protein
MAGLEIIAAEGGAALKDFIDLPWKIYAEYPKWVPPLKKDVRRLLDPSRHPFWEFSERRLLLARRGARRWEGSQASSTAIITSSTAKRWAFGVFLECLTIPGGGGPVFCRGNLDTPAGHDFHQRPA